MAGVLQALGGPEEDTSGGFKYGGWVGPYNDEFLDQVLAEQIGHPFDLLLGRKTYDIFAGFWPHQNEKTQFAAEFNRARKYVVNFFKLINSILKSKRPAIRLDVFVVQFVYHTRSKKCLKLSW